MKDKQTIMFYLNAIHEGGAERVILQLAYRFAQAGYHSVLVTSFIDTNEYTVPDCVKRISIEKEEIRQSVLMRNITRTIAVRKICKQVKPIALVSFMEKPCVRALIATTGLQVKNIISVRNDPRREYPGIIGLLLRKYLIPFADGCVFQTEEAKKWFPEKLQKKSKIILNPVDESFFNIKREKVVKNVVTLGRVVKQKNHELLINAFAKIAGYYPDENLLIYGKGNRDIEDTLKKKVEALGLEKRIKLMGPTTQVENVLAHAKLFVLSSDYEGMPNALMEAMAAGVPCISTDCPCGGPRTLIRNEMDGILVPTGNCEMMAEAISRLLSEYNTANNLSTSAKKRSDIFKPEIIFEQWKNYIEEICNN